MVTPYDAGGEVNLRACRQLVARFIREGAGGIYLCGTTAEAPLLRIEERKAIVECVISEAAGQLPIIVHVGHTAPALAIELARHAVDAGADAISSILPPFFAYTPAQVARYWSTLVEYGDVPFFGYVMQDIGSTREAIQAWLDAVRTVPRFVGLKFTHESAYRVALLRDCGGPELNIFSGSDQDFLACRSQGADAAIGSGYNFALPVWREIDRLYQAGQVQAAGRLMVRAAAFVGRLTHVDYLAKAKWLLARQGIDCGPVRPPLAPAGELPAREMEAIFNELNDLLASVPAA
ncbi:MAG: N-acetylneuraminate lyase [Phycisphaerae bacterium]|jgi:N-acetylneuraminate lyase